MQNKKMSSDGKQSQEAKQCCCDKHWLEATWVEKGSITAYSMQREAKERTPADAMEGL